MVVSNGPGHGGFWNISLCLLCFVVTAGAYVGFDYGTNSDNLPSPAQTVQLLESLSIGQVRIYDTDPAVLAAFSNSSIQLIVGILNDELAGIGQSNTSAATWVNTRLVPFTNKTNIHAIGVGNEVLNGVSNLSSSLVPAMKNIYAALSANNLSSIKVSTPCSMNLLAGSSPPSSGTFDASYTTVMSAILDFLSQTSSFFMLNVYPYKAYAANSASISLDYALFNSTSGVLDNVTGLLYKNLFDSQIDAIYAAIAKFNYTDISIQVSETGWPTAGDLGEVGASVANAKIYNSNLVKHVLNKTGTPGRPGVLIDAYLYELFSEDKNVGASSQRNFGMFSTNSTPLYAVDLSGSNVTNPPRSWCIAKQGTSETMLQTAIDFACGVWKANCTAIQTNGTCFLPDTRYSHASYAMNMYYVLNDMGSGSCSFQGTAQITTTDPSYGSCIYPASSSSLVSKGHIQLPRASLAHLSFTLLLVFAIKIFTS